MYNESLVTEVPTNASDRTGNLRFNTMRRFTRGVISNMNHIDVQKSHRGQIGELSSQKPPNLSNNSGCGVHSGADSPVLNPVSILNQQR